MPEKPIIEPIERSKFTGYHQQSGAGGDDTEFGRDGSPVLYTLRGEHARVPSDDGEEREDKQRTRDRPEIGTAQLARKPGLAAQPLVGRDSHIPTFGACGGVPAIAARTTQRLPRSYGNLAGALLASGAAAVCQRYSPASFETTSALAFVTKPGPELMLSGGMTP